MTEREQFEQLNKTMSQVSKMKNAMVKKTTQELRKAKVKNDETRIEVLKKFLQTIESLELQRYVTGYEILRQGEYQTGYDRNTINLLPICFLLYEYQEEVKRDYQELFQLEGELLIDFTFETMTKTKQIVNWIKAAKQIQKSVENTSVTWRKVVEELEIREVDMSFEITFPGYKIAKIDLQKEENNSIPVCQILSAWVAAIKREIKNNSDYCYVKLERGIKQQIQREIEETILNLDN